MKLLFSLNRPLSLPSFVVLFTLNLVLANAYADDSTAGTWNGLFLQGKLNSETPWGYFFEIQSRLHFNDHGKKGDRILIRPAIRYSLTKSVSLFLGTGWTPNLSPFKNEIRHWQQVQWADTLDHFSALSRTRLEERFIENTTKTGFRFRQLLRVSKPMFTDLHVLAWDELFLNLNATSATATSGFDQNRLFLGVYFPFQNNSSTARLEAGYLNIYTSTLLYHTLALYWFVDLP